MVVHSPQLEPRGEGWAWSWETKAPRPTSGGRGVRRMHARRARPPRCPPVSHAHHTPVPLCRAGCIRTLFPIQVPTRTCAGQARRRFLALPGDIPAGAGASAVTAKGRGRVGGGGGCAGRVCQAEDTECKGPEAGGCVASGMAGGERQETREARLRWPRRGVRRQARDRVSQVSAGQLPSELNDTYCSPRGCSGGLGSDSAEFLGAGGGREGCSE